MTNMLAEQITNGGKAIALKTTFQVLDEAEPIVDGDVLLHATDDAAAPTCKPKRPQTAYNLFFQLERENIIKGKGGTNYTVETIARIANHHYLQSKLPCQKRKVSLPLYCDKETANLSVGRFPLIDLSANL